MSADKAAINTGSDVPGEIWPEKVFLAHSFTQIDAVGSNEYAQPAVGSSGRELAHKPFSNQRCTWYFFLFAVEIPPHLVSLADHSASSPPSTSALPAQTISHPFLLSPEDSSPRHKGSPWKTFLHGLRVLKEVSVIFPPLQAAAGALVSVLEQIGEITDARDGLRGMAQRIAALSTVIQRYSGQTDDEDGDRTATRMIKNKLAEGASSIIRNSPDARYIIERTTAISFLINIFELDMALNTEVKAVEVRNICWRRFPRWRVHPIMKLVDRKEGASACLVPASGVLAELLAWATNPAGPTIFLLTGMAGAGKSAIARSFARLLDDQGLLGASFFCSRGSEARSNVGGIIPSLAFHLAWHSEPFARALIESIKMNPGVTFNLRPADFQVATLMLRPSQSLTKHNSIPILVIDALDECSSTDAIQTLLQTLIRSSGRQLKFFITSRPEPHLRLNDVEHNIVTADIARYLRTNLHDLGSKVAVPEWPSDPELQELVKRTGDLFIFAFTVIQYLSAKLFSRKELQNRLQNVLHNSSPTRIQTAGIDALYGQIVNDAWHGLEPEEQSAREKVLATVLCLREPLSLSSIAGLLQEHLTALLIDIPASLNEPLLVFHASFPDYMAEKRRSGSNVLNVQAHNSALALQCITCMNSCLRQNFFNIGRADSGATIAEDTLNQLIPAHMRYAVMYWGAHLSLIPPDQDGINCKTLISELTILATTHILHWLECLCLIGKLHFAVDCLQKAMLFTLVREVLVIVFTTTNGHRRTRSARKSETYSRK
ncbi:hypothetical protein B0H14DRAFT_3746882 [Mycena olivaceomarginata]|nr:hypothetical protein B0H14DRAFT_3746882 [Mycena olivaceomarginata]